MSLSRTLEASSGFKEALSAGLARLYSSDIFLLLLLQPQTSSKQRNLKSNNRPRCIDASNSMIFTPFAGRLWFQSRSFGVAVF